jgi:hypothetical protein
MQGRREVRFAESETSSSQLGGWNLRSGQIITQPSFTRLSPYLGENLSKERVRHPTGDSPGDANLEMRILLNLRGSIAWILA